MKNIFAKIIIVLGLMIVAAITPGVHAAPAQCGAHGDRNSMLVSTAWLAEHLNDPNVVIITDLESGGFRQRAYSGF